MKLDEPITITVIAENRNVQSQWAEAEFFDCRDVQGFIDKFLVEAAKCSHLELAILVQHQDKSTYIGRHNEWQMNWTLLGLRTGYRSRVLQLIRRFFKGRQGITGRSERFNA